MTNRSLNRTPKSKEEINLSLLRLGYYTTQKLSADSISIHCAALAHSPLYTERQTHGGAEIRPEFKIVMRVKIMSKIIP